MNDEDKADSDDLLMMKEFPNFIVTTQTIKQTMYSVPVLLYQEWRKSLTS